ncbi:MAG: hypothetical protein LBI27_08650 [Clostridiales bacterium]|jgi:sialate O-acetylesterase|nr:hypothetical protein [Clostridiales bacterium]
MITLPSVFSNGMVLAKTAKVWGWTEPNAPVGAKFIGRNYETVSDETGYFFFTFFSEEFGGPHTLTIGEKNIKDVYIGRVWFCGGQSNMEGPLSRTRLNFGEYITDNENIRIFQAEKGLNFDAPQKNVAGKWNTAVGEFLDNMYAVPYFFAQKLSENKKLNDAPIGLVCTPAGGTPIEGWLPEDILRAEFPETIPNFEKFQNSDFIQKATEEADNNIRAWFSQLNKKDAGLKKKWFAPDFDDSSWKERALLDNTDFPKHGSLWMRKKIFLPKQKKNAPSILNLGRVEDSITVYVNGVEVTHIGYGYPPCTCILPKNLLVAGENTIAVRIVGEANNPSIIPGKEYFLIHSEGTLCIGDTWKYHLGAKMPQCPPGVWFYGHPLGVYNFMLAPMLGYSVEGLIWYQGESNTNRPGDYEAMFRAFARHMRNNFGEKLPVIYTQLANFIDPQSLGELSPTNNIPGKRWAEVREHQRACLKIPNTAMAVAIDLGEYNDLHPVNKKSVGERLALHALRMVYNEKIVSDGPTVESAKYSGGKLTVRFTNAQNLWSKHSHTLLDIIENGNTHRVYATIENNTLVALCPKPEKIRYAFTDCPVATLYNAYNLPASPFEINM